MTVTGESTLYESDMSGVKDIVDMPIDDLIGDDEDIEMEEEKDAQPVPALWN